MAEAATEETGGKFGGFITHAVLKERQNPSYICGSCGNMLWNFKNDGSKLIRVCRNCGHKDDMESNLVYVNDVKFAGGTDHVASADMIKDPTLPRADNVDCSSCHHNEAVFFQKPMRGDEGMKLIFMCTRCARAAYLLAPPCVLATLLSLLHPHNAQVRVQVGAVRSPSTPRPANTAVRSSATLMYVARARCPAAARPTGRRAQHLVVVARRSKRWHVCVEGVRLTDQVRRHAPPRPRNFSLLVVSQSCWLDILRAESSPTRAPCP